ncbi:hypothetical protein IL972_00355 [Acinetobacter sp. FL51]|uniref:hypothetical protein n=1 Tax=Acinetobacter sp. FL51 TaxID=2777978 RepID=UPI0018E0CBB4|nr:hypothetical protein [Acinetobacter sp. FL51]MBI1450389.1 hypothetical protein [Acinetobacter sp. FL51]
MTATKVSICNAALSMIGDKSIASFDEDTSRAEMCRNIYDQLRKAVLRDHPWSCAKRRIVLSPVTTRPAFGYANAFPLPADYVRIIATNIESYEVEDRYILANTNQINLEYVYDNQNEDTWDSMLIEALSLKMASRLCKPMTGSDAAGQSAQAEYEKLLKKARFVNSQERQTQNVQFDDDAYTYAGSRY